MSKASLTKDVPQCPLCLKAMVAEYDGIRKIKVWACHKDKIAVSMLDPMIKQWHNSKMVPVPCPMCGKSMRLFFTSTGFMKGVCPAVKCRAEIRSWLPDRWIEERKKMGEKK